MLMISHDAEDYKLSSFWDWTIWFIGYGLTLAPAIKWWEAVFSSKHKEE